jgi:hypothetical protein
LKSIFSAMNPKADQLIIFAKNSTIARIKNSRPKSFPRERMLASLLQGLKLPTVSPKMTASAEYEPPTIVEVEKATSKQRRYRRIIGDNVLVIDQADLFEDIASSDGSGRSCYSKDSSQ